MGEDGGATPGPTPGGQSPVIGPSPGTDSGGSMNLPTSPGDPVTYLNEYRQPSGSPPPGQTFMDQHIQNLTSTDPGSGGTPPRSNQEGLRDLMLPGNEQWMKDINARVAAENGGKGPASLRFDRAGVQAAIGRVEDLVRDVREAYADADLLAKIETRGEQVSDHYAGVANGAGQAYIEYLQKTERDLRAFIEDLEVIRDRYAAQEDDVAEGFNGTGTS